MYSENTLKIKYFPKEFSHEDIEDFLKHFGSLKIKILTSSNTVYAQFESKEIAKSVLFKLHQTLLLNSRLCVEYADHELDLPRPKIKSLEQDCEEVEFFNHFISKINAFNSSVSYNQPPPAHIKYAYPKPNRGTISNIAHVLATVPKFYTQVLHLMNKMNLPPPFVIEDPSQIPLRAPSLPDTPKQCSPQSKQGSSEESELETDDDYKSDEVLPKKRPAVQKNTRIKRPKFIKPNVVQPSSSKPTEIPEDVFEKVNVTTLRKIKLNVPKDSLKPSVRINETTVLNINAPAEEEQTTSKKGDRLVISAEELSANQVPASDLGVLQVFKNYHVGVPTSRLYIKNLAKSVTAEDLKYIYSRYKLQTSEETVSSFDIRLMQEGRMKGQAFVTLDSVELAQKALHETNGFILKDKPLVVVFAKSTQKK